MIPLDTVVASDALASFFAGRARLQRGLEQLPKKLLALIEDEAFPRCQGCCRTADLMCAV